MVEKIETWVAVTVPMLADAQESYRIISLWLQGFGPVRCHRCHRWLRCVTVMRWRDDFFYYGRTCAEKAWNERTAGYLI
jgi:hypothetical protein